MRIEKEQSERLVKTVMLKLTKHGQIQGSDKDERHLSRFQILWPPLTSCRIQCGVMSHTEQGHKSNRKWICMYVLSSVSRHMFSKIDSIQTETWWFYMTAYIGRNVNTIIVVKMS